MKEELRILTSDQPNKDNTCFTVGALEGTLWQAAIYGVPSSLSHDFHRLTGWIYPRGLYFDFGKTFVLGYHYIHETDEEFQNLWESKKNHFYSSQIAQLKPHQEDFLSLLPKKKASVKRSLLFNSIALVEQEEILYDVFPNVYSLMEVNKDKLISIQSLLEEFLYLGGGIFKHKSSDLCVVAHTYFRRSQSILNNYHSIFLDQLVEISHLEGVRTKIKLATELIGYAPSYSQVIEHEYWFGPKYKDNISKIRDGITVHQSKEYERLYYQIDRTEFNWKTNGNLRELEIEEVKDQPRPTKDENYTCRYVHSIYDNEKQEFIHFDGAIREYSGDLMLERIDVKMTEFGRRSNYMKLFRLDGEIPISTWKSLTTNFFQGNIQLYEYFGSSMPSFLNENRFSNLNTVQRLVPYKLNKGDGIRLYVTYHKSDQEKCEGRYVSAFDEIISKDGPKRVLESFIVEVAKAFKRLNIDFEYDLDVILIKAFDYYINVPCVFHKSSTIEEDLKDTLKTYKYLFMKLLAYQPSSILSFTLAWDMEDKEVRLSCYGAIADICVWLNSFSSIPVDRTKFIKWLEDQAKYQEENGKNVETPILSNIIQGDGVMYLKRRSAHLDCDVDIEFKGQIQCIIKNPNECGEIVESINNGELFLTPSVIIKSEICDESGEEYKNSPFSVVLDENMKSRVTSFEYAGLIWTDKPQPINTG